MNRTEFMNREQAKRTGAFVQRNLEKKSSANVSAFLSGWRAAVAAREAFDVAEQAPEAARLPPDGRPHCHARPLAERCDHAGPGGFMGHTCRPESAPAPSTSEIAP